MSFLDVAEPSLEVDACEVVDLPPMAGPTNAQRFDAIDGRLDQVETALSLRPKAKGWLHRRWEWIINNKGTSIILAVILCVVSIVGGAQYKKYLDHSDDPFNDRVDKRIDTKLSPATNKLTDLSERMARVEGKLDVLLAQRFIGVSAQYAKRGEIPLALKAVDKANAALAEAINSKIKSPPEYFQDAIVTLDDAASRARGRTELSSRLHEFRLALAQYRSILEPRPNFPKDSARFPSGGRVVSPDMIQKRAIYLLTRGLTLPTGVDLVSDGAVLDGSAIPSGTSLFTPVTNPRNLKPSSVTGLILIAPRQVLDRIEWRNVTFVNTHITYNGGPLHLENVLFVKCKFEIPNSERRVRAANYAALLTSHLTIG